MLRRQLGWTLPPRCFPLLTAPNAMAITLAVPLLRVTDVARSMAWYHDTLGFTGDPFPAKPPFEFTILRKGAAEIMLRRGVPRVSSKPQRYDWDVYLRIEGSRFREVCAHLQIRGIVNRPVEQMPYGLAEFEIVDPDGHVLCLSQELDNEGDVPRPS